MLEIQDILLVLVNFNDLWESIGLGASVRFFWVVGFSFLFFDEDLTD